MASSNIGIHLTDLISLVQMSTSQMNATSPSSGERPLIYNTDQEEPFFWNGSSWASLVDGLPVGTQIMSLEEPFVEPMEPIVIMEDLPAPIPVEDTPPSNGGNGNGGMMGRVKSALKRLVPAILLSALITPAASAARRVTEPDLPTSCQTGRIYIVTDASSATECTAEGAGGGATRSICMCDSAGTGYIALESTGATSPGGADTQVQFNNAGAFDGDADMTWDDTGHELTIGAANATGGLNLPQSDSPADPTLTIGAEGFYSSAAGQINASIGGSGPVLDLRTNSVGTGLSTGPRLLREVASATNPSLIPHADDEDTGIGRTLADGLALVVGADEAWLFLEGQAGTSAGDSIARVSDVATAPSSNPAGGVYLYSDADTLYIRATDGTVTDLAGAGGATNLNDIGDADGTGTVAVAEHPQTWSWTSANTAAALDAFTLDWDYPSTVSTDSGTQRLFHLNFPDNAGDATGQIEAMLSIDNADANDAPTYGLDITATQNWGTAALRLPSVDDASPSLCFGDCDTGWMESSDDVLQSVIGGNKFTFKIGSGTAGASSSSRVQLMTGENSTATNPVLVPSGDDVDTGVGRAAEDQLSFTAGGVEGLRLTESTTVSAQLPSYGSGSITGTDAYWLAVDASGNVIEEAAPAGTGDITAVGDCTTADCFTSGSPDAVLTFDNATSGTVTLQTVAGALGAVTVSLPAATDTLVGKATTDTLTNKTIDATNTVTVEESDISDLDHTATSITDGLIVEADLNADEAPTDDDILTYDTTGANFSWQTPAELSLAASGSNSDITELTGLTTDLTVAQGGTGAGTFTDGGILLGSGTSAITALGVATNGQIPIGDGATDPVLNEIDGTANEIDITNTAGAIQVGIVANPTLAGANFSAIPTSALLTEVRSMYWPAGSMSSDGTQCADPAESTINSGPKTFTIICTDNDASVIHGSVVMPDSWDAGNLTMELAYIQTAADTSALEWDIYAQCRGATETVNNTWETAVNVIDAAVTGSNAVDHTTSGNVTCASDAAGDTLFWKIEIDATGTTTAMATVHFIGMKLEYTSDIGD